jgi:uncharacterized membrane protein YgdD (TMEM256/DUF423 family)
MCEKIGLRRSRFNATGEPKFHKSPLYLCGTPAWLAVRSDQVAGSKHDPLSFQREISLVSTALPGRVVLLLGLCEGRAVRHNARQATIAKDGDLLAPTILMVLAGLMGASGIALAAAGAHAAPNAGLDSAGHMLLFHAAALLGGTALAQQGLVWRPLLLAVLFAWVAGAALFSGDIAMRAFAGHRLFAFAAPAGGIILIAAWLALAAAAISGLIRHAA